jgi:hypothetical protein
LGFIISLKNVFEVFEIIQQYHMDYLLTFKLSQDFIETFFSFIRGRGGFNNNPNAQQFESAYNKLLITNDGSTSYNSNCCIEDVSILSVSSSRNVPSPIGDVTNLHNDFFGHDYMYYKIVVFVTVHRKRRNLYSWLYLFESNKKKITCDVCKK